ncbi:MAG: response regulator [Anaerolineae bacterium]|nr:response regulator [Anaerolineae bacterium]
MTQTSVLILEDDGDLLELFSRALIRGGYEVTTAKNLQTGRSILQQRRFDVFLCDMRLPDGDGLDLLKELFPHLKAQSTQIVVVSAEDRHREPCLELGVEFFLSKPVSIPMLMNLLERLGGNTE